MTSSDRCESWELLKFGGPDVDGVTATCVALDSSNNVYVGTADAGVMQPSLEGKKLLPRSQEGLSIESLYYDDAHYVSYAVVVEYVPAEEDLHAGEKRVGFVYISRDSCRTWDSLLSEESAVQCVTVHPSGKVIIGTEKSGVLLSKNQGKSWKKIGLADREIRSVAVSDSVTFVAATSEGAFATADVDKMWNEIYSPG